MSQNAKNKPDKSSVNDQRKYIRLQSVFPVEFAVIRGMEELSAMDWRQGYTSNVSKGGICLETVSLDDETFVQLNEGLAYFELRIHIPLSYAAIKAGAEVAWIKKVDQHDPGKYLIGLRFTSVAEFDVQRMVSYAHKLKFSTGLAYGISIALFIVLAAIGGYNYKLRVTNETLVSSLVELQQEEIKTNKDVEDIVREGNLVLSQIRDYTGDEMGRKNLENRYEDLVARRDGITDQLEILARKKGGLQKTVLEKMHLWLQNHQNPTTGLILSFEGEDVGVIKDWAFIYDQALAAQVFLSFGDEEAARKVLNFFNLEIKKGAFEGLHNGYYYDSGEVAEHTVHCGPNIWVAISALQYIHLTGDKYYLPMVRTLTDWLITIQDRDPAGGLKGGPEFTWFATEHNLDAYALFSMMYQMTGEEKYRTARKKVLSWLKTYALIPHGKDYKSPPVNRGRGDATIATDTYAWALAAIGPQKLEDIGMDPEAIMKFAEIHCAVEVKYKRPSGVVLDVKGFDFAKYAHMPRGGLISPEWTSQMIVSLRMLSEYFAKKDNFYKEKRYAAKAEMYLNELNKLIIASPSARGLGAGCLPYATLEDADTGHGWNTPYGASTCSVAGTAYMIMAIKEWNPLMFQRGGLTFNEGGRQ